MTENLLITFFRHWKLKNKWREKLLQHGVEFINFV